MQLAIPRVIKNWEYASQVKPCTRLDRFSDNNYGRRYASQPTAPYWKEAFAAFKLRPGCVEPGFQNMTTNHFLDGACTHRHIDDSPEGYVHVRCNVMLEKPPIGGNPILDDERVEVEVGDMWICLASLEWHASEPIQGGQRVMFSFGGLVPLEQVNKILA